MALLLATLTFTAAAGTMTAYADGTGTAITGKDGWYFITHDSTLEDYRGSNLYTTAQLQVILQNFINMRDTLEENGIKFVVFLAPNKESIYSEYMPDSYGPRAPYTRIEQVYDLIKDEVTVIYPEEMLREAKVKYPMETYYKTDPHWNAIGTYLCSKLLMEELGVKMPELEDLTITAEETDDLTCAQLLGRKIPDTEYTVTGYENLPKLNERILICGDSFGMSISDCISPIVSDCFIIHRDYYEPELPYMREDTVLIYEVVERFMDGIPFYSVV